MSMNMKQLLQSKIDMHSKHLEDLNRRVENGYPGTAIIDEIRDAMNTIDKLELQLAKLNLK